MSLLIDLLTFPVLGPIRGVKWIAEKVAEQAENELSGDDDVHKQLTELELRFELGEISEKEFEEAEETLLRRLRAGGDASERGSESASDDQLSGTGFARKRRAP